MGSNKIGFLGSLLSEQNFLIQDSYFHVNFTLKSSRNKSKKCPVLNYNKQSTASKIILKRCPGYTLGKIF